MTRPKERITYVKFVRSRGKWYPYFDTGQVKPKIKDGKTVYVKVLKRLPFYGSVGFWDTYNALKSHRERREKREVVLSVDGFMALYEASAKFKSLSPNSQTAYGHAFKHIRKAFGKAPANDLSPKDVLTFQSKTSAATGNLVTAVIRAAYTWGRPLEIVSADPCKDVKGQKTGSHEPWPEDLLEDALESDDRLVRLGVHLLFYTGQRIGDVCSLRWKSIKDDHVSLVQQKTKKPLDIPLHQALADEIAKTKKTGMTILSDDVGRPITDNELRAAIKVFTGGRFVPHGLRKNAVIALLEAGCSHKEVQSITGQSLQMIEYYAQRINQRKVAGSAVLKWQKNGTETGKQRENIPAKPQKKKG